MICKPAGSNEAPPAKQVASKSPQKGLKTALSPPLVGRAEHRSGRGIKTRGCLSEASFTGFPLA